MVLKSSTTRYGAIAASIHWLSALAIILMLVSGLVMGEEKDLVPLMLPWHATLGVVVGVLTLFRIVWWLAFDRLPRPVEGMSQMQEWAARLVHLGLYVAMLVMVASGIATLALSGGPEAVFSGGPLPDFDDVPPFGAHELVSRLLIGLVIAHVGAALFHQFVRRDGLIGRMRLG
jgi:cytochrome b561